MCHLYKLSEVPNYPGVELTDLYYVLYMQYKNTIELFCPVLVYLANCNCTKICFVYLPGRELGECCTS